MNASLIVSGWGKKLGKKLMKGPTKLKPKVEMGRWNIVSGDVVQVIQGPQTGQKGKVIKILREKNRVIIENVNMRRRVVKAKADGTPGRLITRACAVHYSNVMLLDPTTGKPTKISRRFLEDGTKVRVSKASGHVIVKPNPLQNRKPRSLVQGPKDTSAVDAHSVTFADYEKILPYIYKTFKPRF
jgi:large subunit ribosomal protein L24